MSTPLSTYECLLGGEPYRWERHHRGWRVFWYSLPGPSWREIGRCQYRDQCAVIIGRHYLDHTPDPDPTAPITWIPHIQQWDTR